MVHLVDDASAGVIAGQHPLAGVGLFRAAVLLVADILQRENLRSVNVLDRLIAVPAAPGR